MQISKILSKTKDFGGSLSSKCCHYEIMCWLCDCNWI